jgi:hypothetical protein
MQSNEVVEIEYQSHPSVVVNPWMVINQQAFCLIRPSRTGYLHRPL